MRKHKDPEVRPEVPTPPYILTTNPELWLAVPTSGKTELAKSNIRVFDLDSLEKKAWPAWRNEKLYLDFYKNWPEYTRRIGAAYRKMKRTGALACYDLVVTSIACDQLLKQLRRTRYDIVILRDPKDVKALCRRRGGWQIKIADARRFTFRSRQMYEQGKAFRCHILRSDEYLSDYYQATLTERAERYNKQLQDYVQLSRSRQLP